MIRPTHRDLHEARNHLKRIPPTTILFRGVYELSGQENRGGCESGSALVELCMGSATNPGHDTVVMGPGGQSSEHCVATEWYYLNRKRL